MNRMRCNNLKADISIVMVITTLLAAAANQNSEDIASCAKRCLESYFPGKPCYCNEACLQFENCCYDYVALCNPQLATNDSALHFKGHIYKYTEHGSITATLAQKACQDKMGALLVSINTKDEFDFIESEVLRGRTLSTFIGGTDIKREGQWTWADGTPMSLPTDPWHSWLPGEPDNDRGTEHCSVMTNYEYWKLRKLMLDNYVWRDYSCDLNAINEIQGYICEGTEKCEPNPCLNGGSCMYTGQVAEFECLCQQDYVGDLCQYKIQEGKIWEICGETNLNSTNGTSGLITSPLYPKYYPPNVRCQWYITTYNHSTIAIRIDSLNIEYVKQCMFDSLIIYDGHSANDSTVLFGPFCGVINNSIVLTSSSNKALIAFNTDKDVGETGFKLSYSQHICGEGTGSSGCGTRSMYRSQCGEIDLSDGSFISQNLCDWYIILDPGKYINITFTMFKLVDTGYNCISGGLEIYDGPDSTHTFLGKYCGHRSPFTVYSSTSNIYIRLINASKLTENEGFRLQYESYDPSSFKYMNNNHSVEGTSGVFNISESYVFSKTGTQLVYKWHIKVPYGLHLELNWNIIPTGITHFKIFKGFSQFLIHQETYNYSSFVGSIMIPYFQSIVEITVSQNNIPKFNGSYMAIEWYTEKSHCFRPLFYDNTSAQVTENNYVSSLQPVMLQLSNVSDYNSGIYCKWLIRGQRNVPLALNIIDANIYPIDGSCSYDGLVLYDGPDVTYPQIGPFCGSSSLLEKKVITTKSDILVVFYSDPSFGKRVNGDLRALIHQEPLSCPVWNMNEPTSETFTASCGTVLSPNFPGLVKSGLWFWIFIPPENHYISLQVYYVRGPGISDTTCQQSLKVLEIPKDSASLRMYEKELVTLCGSTDLFVPTNLIKVPPHQKMGIELNTISNILPQSWQFKMSFTTHQMAKPKNDSVTGLCPPEYIEWRGYCYKYYQWVRRHYVPEEYPWQLSWHNALQYCQSQNGTLLTIYDEEEAYFIKYTLANEWFWDPAAPINVNHRLIYLGLKNRDSAYTWMDGIKLSYADWYKPRPEWSQSIFYPDSALPKILNKEVPEPSAGVGSLCTGMLPLTPFESLNWVKIPCDYPIWAAGTICKKPVNNTVKTHTRNNLNQQNFAVCADGYFMVNDECITLLTNYSEHGLENSSIEIFTMTMYDAVIMCENHGGLVYQNISVDTIDILMEYLELWNHTTVFGDILLTVNNSSNTCNAIQVTSENGKSVYRTVEFNCEDNHLQDLQLSNVLCGKSPIVVEEMCSSHEFVCGSKECLSIDSVCDGIHDCNDNSDEQNCECDETRFQCDNGKCFSLSVRCDFIDNCGDMSDEAGCVSKACSDNEFKCDNTQCIPRDDICNFKYNCIDGSDEKPDLCGQLCRGFQCYSGQCLNKTLQNDGISDCPGLLFEDEIFEKADTTTFLEKEQTTYKKEKIVLSNGCNEGPEYVKCHLEETSCYQRSKACVYDTILKDDNSQLEVLESCRDGYHLRKNCENVQCPGMFHCPGSYCIPLRKVCDGILDCPMGQDESKCQNYTCPGLFRCKSSGICIPHFEVCNGINNCGGYNEDERYCGKIDPVCDICSCKGFIAHCQHKNITLLPHSNNTVRQLRALFADHNFLTITEMTFKGLHWLIKLTIRHNSLQHISQGVFKSLLNLQHLDLSHNSLSVMQYDVFTGLDNLKHLNLSSNMLKGFEKDTFIQLITLHHLVIENNPFLTKVNPQSFERLSNLRILNSDAYKFCCIAKQVVNCTPTADEFSNCEDLMANYPLQVSIWILGIIATVGNIFVIIWRALKDNLKVSSMFIMNLGCSDMLMGIYLLIIGGVDMYYRGSYIIHADNWRSSTLCQIAGVLAMLSSEVSVFTLTAITIDRCMAIMFPLKFGQFRMKHARIVMITGWIVCFFLSVLPVTKTNYFGNAFFGRTGVCLPFQVSSEKLPGWEYSVFIFLVLNLISFIAIFVCYTAIFISVQSSIKTLGDSASKSTDEYSLAKKLMLIVATDFCCWVPIILIGFAALGGAVIPPQVSAWIAVFILPLNSAVNPILYTISAIDCKKKKNTRSKSYYSNTAYTDVSDTTKSIRNKCTSEKCHNQQISFVLDANNDSTKL